MVCLSNCVMPAYTPALQKDEGLEREDLITSYFNQGLTNAEIVGFLVLRHGIVCSVRTLKRILKRLGLKRAGHNNESLIEHIVGAILSVRIVTKQSWTITFYIRTIFSTNTGGLMTFNHCTLSCLFFLTWTGHILVFNWTQRWSVPGSCLAVTRPCEGARPLRKTSSFLLLLALLTQFFTARNLTEIFERAGLRQRTSFSNFLPIIYVLSW